MSGEASGGGRGPVSKGRGWAKGFWWTGYCCLLPLAAGVLVFVFLTPQLGSGGWKLRRDAPLPLRFDGLLTGLPAAAHIRLNAVLSEATNYTRADLNQAASAAGVTAWRLSTGLALVVMAVGIFISGYVISHAPRGENVLTRKRLSLAMLIFGAAAAALLWWLFVRGAVWPSTAMTRQFLASVQRGLNDGVSKEPRCAGLEQVGCSALVDWELLVTYVGYLMAVYLLCASGAVLLPGRGGAAAEARLVAAQMSRLRLLLYVGAVALAVTTLRARMSFNWALDYLPPLSLLEKDAGETLAAAILYQRLGGLVSNVVTSVAALNTILLAAVYIPAALVLRKRAEDVTRPAMEEEASQVEPPRRRRRRGVGRSKEKEEAAEPKAPSRAEWMQARGLVFPLKDHLGRIAAILSPLLAGPIAELLSLLKG